MKCKKVSMIDALRVTQDINRAGRNAGVTAIARLLGVTPSRAKRLIDLAIGEELIYSFRQNYRSNLSRKVYSPTACGLQVLYQIEEVRRRKLIPNEPHERQRRNQ